MNQFVTKISRLNSELDYRRLIARHGVRRNANHFWKLSDKFHQIYAQQQPLEAGLFDYNRLENR